MVAMYRKDGYGDVNVRILIVDMIESPGCRKPLIAPCRPVNPLPLEAFAGITEHLQLAWFVPIAVDPQRSHNLVHCLPRWFVVMKEVPRKQYHVHIPLFGQAHDFVEGLGAVIAPNVIPLIVANMTVGGN